MNSRTIQVALLVCVVALCSLAFKCGGGEPSSIAEWKKMPVGGYAIVGDVEQTSPAGIRWHGRRALSPAQMQAMDEGFLARVAVARKDGHTLALEPEFYTVFQPWTDCVQSPVQRVYSFKVRGSAEYDGSEYDQLNTKGKLPSPVVRNGITYLYQTDDVAVILAAEMVIDLGTNGSTGKMFACPEILGEAVPNGFDHIVLAMNPNTYPDGYEWFWRTIIHGPTHPLLPRPPETSSAVAPKSTRVPAVTAVQGLATADGTFVQADGIIVRPVR